VTPGDEALDRRFGPLEHRFHASIGKVANRASEAGLPRLIRAHVSEENTLDAAAHEDARTHIFVQYLGMLRSI